MSEWRPIETAPKDGTRVLTWSKSRGLLVAFLRKPHLTYWSTVPGMWSCRPYPLDAPARPSLRPAYRGDGMSERSEPVTWWPNWYVTRMHAIRGTDINAHAVCGFYVDSMPRREWRERLLAAGPPRCKKCERILASDQPLPEPGNEP